ncbi:maleylacetate reductase [Pseudomonas jinjuensis]|uniref:Alcohol dehydrogenase, class IV n=1 Tax=Pseudomonas jinjuensis TaxID=198616 RepID=A0A1H0NHH7_9PSED|nr:maleylacetate reductase [Pseudomonas jinjuensis]SDO92051.1 Alcohol dehydrogenase, class IV [Pseudomonas jinjuensis]
MSIQAFLHDEPASRVIFGRGSRAQVAAELDALGARRALVLSTPDQTALGERIAELLGERSAGVHGGAVMHVPLEAARKAIAVAREAGADACVAVGGGSTIGLAKAIALESSLPILALPTTYAGSEMTPLYGITADGEKKTGRDWKVAPRTVIYDPELSVGLPLAISVSSGMNAIAHAAEALYAHNASPVHKLMAEEGIRALAAALPQLQRDPADLDARGDALYGAWLCGAVLGRVQMGLHHKLCHVLGGSFNLPHAELHTVILPHALAYNAAAAPQAMQALARALGGTDGIAALVALGRQLDAPRSLREIGMPADGLERAADLAVAAPYPNPRPLDRTALRELLQRAFDGAEPR